MGYKANKLNTDQNSNSLHNRLEKLLESLEWSDCCFTVSGKCFRAHKLIMSISSPVFKAMLFGPLSTNEDIIITDIEPDAFQLLLNYIYTDKVKITSIDQAFGLLYASKKYMLEPLGDMCIAYVQAHLSVDNVCTVLNYADFIHEKELICSSMEIFCAHAHYLLQEKKNTLSLPAVRLILERDQINISEKDLIEYVFHWIVQYCEQNSLPKTLKDRREILMKNGIFKLLRFFALSSEELNEIISEENNVLLPLEEDAFRGKSKSTYIENKAIVDYVCCIPVPRNKLELECQFCYRSPAKSVSPITIDSNNYVIHTRVKANKSIFITSLRVPTRLEPVEMFQDYLTNYASIYSEKITISVVNESDDSIIKLTDYMNKVEYNSAMDIDLSEHCYIKKEKWYKISFAWPPNTPVSHKYVVEYRDRYYNDNDIKIVFEDISGSGNNGWKKSFLTGLKFCL